MFKSSPSLNNLQKMRQNLKKKKNHKSRILSKNIQKINQFFQKCYLGVKFVIVRDREDGLVESSQLLKSISLKFQFRIVCNCLFLTKTLWCVISPNWMSYRPATFLRFWFDVDAPESDSVKSSTLWAISVAIWNKNYQKKIENKAKRNTKWVNWKNVDIDWKAV